MRTAPDACWRMECADIIGDDFTIKALSAAFLA